MVDAIGRIDEIDRSLCRDVVEARFTIERMVDDYERTYARILGSRPVAGRAKVAAVG
jgi:hypothetical protein